MMKKIKKTNQKRTYEKPKVDIVKIDNEITVFMMSFPQDPQGMNTNSPMDSDPFKIKNLS